MRRHRGAHTAWRDATAKGDKGGPCSCPPTGRLVCVAARGPQLLAKLESGGMAPIAYRQNRLFSRGTRAGGGNVGLGLRGSSSQNAGVGGIISWQTRYVPPISMGSTTSYFVSGAGARDAAYPPVQCKVRIRPAPGPRASDAPRRAAPAAPSYASDPDAASALAALRRPARRAAPARSRCCCLRCSQSHLRPTARARLGEFNFWFTRPLPHKPYQAP